MNLRNRLPRPKLEPQDPGFATIEFQFVPSKFSESLAAVWAGENTMGRKHPILQYAGQDSQTYNFQMVLFAETGLDDISHTIVALKAAVQQDDKLKRPPIWKLTWGNFLVDDSVVIDRVSIDYGRVRTEPDIGDVVIAATGIVSGGFGQLGGLATGKTSWDQVEARAQTHGGLSMSPSQLRSATVDVQLRHYQPFDVKLSTEKPGNTFYHNAREGDTYELLGRLYFGNPLKGEFLRRMNPDKPWLEPGDEVYIPKPEYFRGYTPSPLSIPLRRTSYGLKARAEIANLRANPLVVHRAGD